MSIYKPVIKKTFTCICGCKRKRKGNAQAKYYETYCRVRAFRKRRNTNSVAYKEYRERRYHQDRIRFLAEHALSTISL